MINVFSPSISFSDKIALLKTINNKEISGTSNVINEFEENLSRTFNRKHTTAVSNGSLALDLALQLIDLKKGDEVIIPSFTIVSCLSSIMRTEATPVFCDVDPLSWNMTLENVKGKYSENTKAVLLVHTYGLPAEATDIESFCKEKNIILIEDAAEAHGQTDNDRVCGSFGEISTMSFYTNKHITTGEGGAVLVDSDELSKKAKQMRNLDFTSENRFQHKNMYWNYRMGGLQASLGISQIKKLDKTIAEKIKQGEYYQELLNDYDDIIQLPLREIRKSLNHYWVFGIVLKKSNIRDTLMKKLYDSNIETRPFFYPLHLQPFFKEKNKNSNESLTESENLGQNGLYIPIGSHLDKRKQKFIVKTLTSAVKELSKNKN